MITGMDRLAAALRGEESDRIPVFCNLLDQGARELGISMEAYYSSGEAVAEAQLRMAARYGHDNLWCLFYVGKEAELLGGGKPRFVPDGPPNVEHFLIQSWADVDALEVPEDIESHPAFAESMRCLDILRAEAGGRQPLCAYITGALSLPPLLMGMDRWLELLLFGPFDVRERLLAKCSALCRAELAAYRQSGVDVLVYSQPFGSTDLLPLRLIRELTFPWMARDLADGVDGVVYYTGTSPLNNVIDEVIRRFGISVFYLGPGDDVARGKELVAGRGLTCGTINDLRLIDWSPAQVRQEVRRILAAGVPGGRFLFGTLVMPLAIPEANIEAMMDAAREFGLQKGG